MRSPFVFQNVLHPIYCKIQRWNRLLTQKLRSQGDIFSVAKTAVVIGMLLRNVLVLHWVFQDIFDGSCKFGFVQIVDF